MAPQFDLIHVSPTGEVRTDMVCTSCNLCESPELTTNCMTGTGAVGVDFFFCGFAPGSEDDRIGDPFTGENGRIFRQLLSEADIDSRRCYLTNCCKCAPYEQTIKDAHWKACRGHLIEELNRIEPKCIVSLGAKALKWLTGFSGVRRFRRHGIPCVFAPEIIVYPMEQPLSIKFAKGQDYYALRAQLVDDLLWLRHKADSGTLHESDDVERDYKVATTVQDVREFLAEFDDLDIEVCCDLETADANYDPQALCTEGGRIVLFAISKGPGHGRAIPYHARGVTTLFWWSEEEFAEVSRLLNNFIQTPGRKWFGFNFTQFDGRWLDHEFNCGDLNIVHEPQYSAHLLDETSVNLNLEDLTLQYTNMPPWKPPSLKVLLKDTKRLAVYGCTDVDATARLMPVVRAKLNESQTWLHEHLQIPLGHELRRAEYQGIRVSQENLERLGSKLNTIITGKKTELYAMDCVKVFQLQRGESFNPNAPHHVAWVMEHILKLPKVKETGTGRYSTDREVLDHYGEEPFCATLQIYKRASKLEGTYYQGIKSFVDRYGEYVHPSILQHRTTTGRLASREPNLFNQVRVDTAMKAGLDEPSLMKDIFISSPGCCLLQIDAKQSELRTLAMYSKDPALTQVYIDGGDLHSSTAAAVYDIPIDEFLARLAVGDKVAKGYRSEAKILNFGIPYGMGQESIVLNFVSAARKEARKAGKEFTPQDEAEVTVKANRFFAKHQESFPGVWAWLNEQEIIVRTYRQQSTFFGRTRRYHKIDNEAIRRAKNFPIQCLHPNTMILTERGYLPLSQITKTDRVWDGANWAKCILHGPRRKKEYIVCLSNGLTIQCSGDHRFELEDGRWKRAKDLQPTDHLVPSCAFANSGKEPRPLSEEDFQFFNKRRSPGGSMRQVRAVDSIVDIFWVFGLMVGDGYYAKPSGTFLVVGYHEVGIYQRLTHFLIRNNIDYKESIQHYRGRPSYWTFRFGAAFHRLMAHYGFPMVSKTAKDVAPQLLSGDASLRSSFLRGLFDADAGLIGSANKGFSLNLNIVAPALARNTCLLLQSLGIYAQVRQYQTTHRDVHRVVVPPSELRWYQQFVGFTAEKKHRLAEVVVAFHDLQQPGPKKDAITAVHPLSVRASGDLVDMWDLEVCSPRHAFVAGGVSVHNSSSSDFNLFTWVRAAPYLRKHGYKAKIILSVYDSLLVDCPLDELWDVAGIIKGIWENLGFGFMGRVPMEVDVEAGTSGWGSLREVNLETREIKNADGKWVRAN